MKKFKEEYTEAQGEVGEKLEIWLWWRGERERDLSQMLVLVRGKEKQTQLTC